MSMTGVRITGAPNLNDSRFPWRTYDHKVESWPPPLQAAYRRAVTGSPHRLELSKTLVGMYDDMRRGRRGRPLTASGSWCWGTTAQAVMAFATVLAEAQRETAEPERPDRSWRGDLGVGAAGDGVGGGFGRRRRIAAGPGAGVDGGRP